MKIAVIGATGLIGHHTAKAITDRGHELVVIHRQSSNLDRLSDLSFSSAIADLNATSGPYAHLAAVLLKLIQAYTESNFLSGKAREGIARRIAEGGFVVAPGHELDYGSFAR